jgi:hypothetical protein
MKRQCIEAVTGSAGRDRPPGRRPITTRDSRCIVPARESASPLSGILAASRRAICTEICHSGRLAAQGEMRRMG